MKLTYICPICHKNSELVKSEYRAIFKKTMNTYSCGHSLLETPIVPDPIPDFASPPKNESEKAIEISKTYASVSGKMEAYDYQKRGIEFIEATNYNCMIADAMGLGKTIQAILAAKKIKTKLFPIAIIVKSATTFQWCREIHAWYDNKDLTVFPIMSSMTPAVPGFDIYIISMDTLGRNGTYKKLVSLGIKMVIVDECHSFKDPSAKRTKALLSLINEGGIKHKILLSGTPIKNRANEYFVALNMLRPDMFPSLARFQTQWLEMNEKGVYSRIKQYRLEDFKKMTSTFILRREKTEVLKNLPALNRNEQYMEIEDPVIKNSYNNQLSIFDNFKLNGREMNQIELLGWLAKLRQLTGMAKVSRCLEYVEEFLENFDSDKLAIGIHHQGVRETLYHVLRGKGVNAIKLSGEDSAEQKDRAVQMFARPENRVLIINTLSGGVGLNLQFCANSIILERQWSAADEEQFESRFHRNGQERPVFIDYLLASGTIDQFLAEKVEEKRKICGETLDGWDYREDTGFLRDLAETVASNRL